MVANGRELIPLFAGMWMLFIPCGAYPGLYSVAAQQNNNESHRFLRRSYHVIPFTITWRIQINENDDRQMDRQPTVEEYEGVAQATSEWIAAMFEKIYVENKDLQSNDNSSIILREVPTVVNSATWEPATTVLSDGESHTYFPHTISLNSEVHFQRDPAVDPDPGGDNYENGGVPTVGSFLLDMSMYSSVADFISRNLHQSGRSSSIWRSTRRAVYAGHERGSYHQVDPPGDNNQMGAPNSSSTVFDNIYTMTFDLYWNLAIGGDSATGILDRVATQEEYFSVVEATQAWLRDNSNSYYFDNDTEDTDIAANNSKGFRLHQVSTQLVGRPTWDASKEYPHSLRVGVMLVWKASHELYLPTVEEFLRDMSTGFSLVEFLRNYLHATDGLFGHAQRVSYGSSYTNPGLQLVENQDGVGVDGGSDDQSATIEDQERFEDAFPVTVPFTLAFSLDELNSSTSPEPSEGDWQGLLEVIQDFLEALLIAHFSGNDMTAASLGGVQGRWTQTSYRPWETRFPYRANVELTLWFATSNDAVILPLAAVYDYQFLFSGLFGGNAASFISDNVSKVEPETNPFQYVDEFVWGL